MHDQALTIQIKMGPVYSFHRTLAQYTHFIEHFYRENIQHVLATIHMEEDCITFK